MSPAHAFLVVVGVVLAIFAVAGAASLWLLRAGRRRVTFPRPDRRGAIAEHQEHYRS